MKSSKIFLYKLAKINRTDLTDIQWNIAKISLKSAGKYSTGGFLFEDKEHFIFQISLKN